MPIENLPADEIKILEKLQGRNKDLRDRMDLTFKHFRGDKFEIPKAEGKWESVTTNRAPSEGWKIINFLASAKRKLSEVMIASDKAKKREQLSYNELLVNGMLYSADRRMDGDPTLSSIQGLMSFYRVVRGWGAYRLLVCEDDDDKPYLDLAVWDPRNVTYLAGKDHFLKGYYETYADADQVKDEYPGWNGKIDDKTGLVKLIDIWDCSDKKIPAQEAVIVEKEYVKEPEDILIGGQKIHYLPIRIKAGGTVPLINDENKDNIAHVGQDYQANYRDLLDVQSRLLSYNLTRAGMEAKMPQIILYDSTKGDLPPEMKKDPMVKGGFIFLDVGRGQSLSPPIQLPPGDKINLMLSQVNNMVDDGGLSRIFSGETSVAMTAFGMNLMNQNTSRQIWPFKLAIEQDYIWMAAEICSQYKKGSYKKTNFEGYDSKQERFSTEIKPGDIVEGREFECKLMVDELSDRAGHIAAAAQEIAAGLNSRKGAIDIHGLSQDPDATLKQIAEEKARELFNIGPLESFIALVEDYKDKPDAGKALILEEALKAILMLKTQGQPETEQPINVQGQPGPGRIRPATKPGMKTRTPQENIPEPIKQAVRNSTRGQ